MLTRRSAARRRAGTASVEAAVVLNLVVVPLMIGVWEMGRLVHAQQVVANACREGGRLAAQGKTVSLTGAPADITWNTNALNGPNVKDTVYQSLVTGGLSELTPSDVTISWACLDSGGATITTVEPNAAPKLQRFRVTVSIPFDKVKWVNLGLVNPTAVTYSVDWYTLVDDPFALDTSMPPW